MKPAPPVIRALPAKERGAYLYMRAVPGRFPAGSPVLIEP